MVSNLNMKFSTTSKNKVYILRPSEYIPEDHHMVFASLMGNLNKLIFFLIFTKFLNNLFYE